MKVVTALVDRETVEVKMAKMTAEEAPVGVKVMTATATARVVTVTAKVATATAKVMTATAMVETTLITQQLCQATTCVRFECLARFRLAYF